MKIKEKGITIPKEILAYVKSDQDKQEDEEEEIVKENAKIHYDKEDLISFHQLFISKPLTKAA
jgi:hypothetical protein